jgi:hypothetical protein
LCFFPLPHGQGSFRPTRLRAVTVGACAGDGDGSFRLNPGIAVAPVDWEALEGHSCADVREVAREMRKRGK